MAILGRFIKQPVEVMDYQFDFSAWLADRADTISGTPTVVSVALTSGATALTISNISQNAGIVRFFVAGGTTGTKHEISCTVNTAGGRTKQSEMIITVKDF